MGKKLPVVSVSKLVEVLKCPRCAWFMIHRGVKGVSNAGWRSRDKRVIQECYDRARKEVGTVQRLGWPRSRRLPRAVLLTGQETADRFRNRLKYVDTECGFIVRGRVDDALWALRTQAHLPIKVAFPDSTDQEIGRLRQARLDETVRLLKESGFRVFDRVVVAEYFSTPSHRGSTSAMPGWRCEIRVVPTSLRRSRRLHRAMQKILALRRPPRASKECRQHHWAREEMRLR